MSRFLIEILEASLQVALPAVVAVILLQKRTRENYLRISLFAIIYVVYQMMLVSPKLFETLRFVGSKQWNWEGKILAIIFGLICYFLFNKYFREHNFFTLKQDKKSNKLTWFITIFVIVSISTLFYFIDSSTFDIETLAFQLTMPGFDEEIIFRGVLLGLLLTVLPDKISFLGNPAVLLTAILFGLMHGLTLSKQLELDFDWMSFLHTGIGGWVFGWLAYKSRSIVKPIIAHGGTNFLAAMATMVN